MTKHDLVDIVEQAMIAIGGVALGGKATPAQVAKWIWDNHEGDLRASGDLFYTWQYDSRWAAQRLVDQGKLIKKKHGSGLWTRIK